MTSADGRSLNESSSDCEERAAETFVRRRFGPWTTADQNAFEAQLASDPAYADATRRVEESWQATGDHATSAELMLFREQAIARARRANARRWLRAGHTGGRGWRIAASIAVAITVLATALQLSPWGYRPGVYRTGFGEQRTIELQDHSRIALDARTRLRVRLSDDARVVELEEGQAQFSVAKDPARPFKVVAGDRTIIAVGTVFTVEYVDHEVDVAMLEGRVAVLQNSLLHTADVSSNRGADSSGVASRARAPARPVNQISPEARRGTDGIIELAAGEALQVRQDGRTTFVPKADLEAATAWRQGKVIFRSEPLREAVRRVNRYSRTRLVVDDPALAELKLSGVFESGDTQAFAEAVQSYLPVVADTSESGTIHLRTR